MIARSYLRNPDHTTGVVKSKAARDLWVVGRPHTNVVAPM